MEEFQIVELAWLVALAQVRAAFLLPCDTERRREFHSARQSTHTQARLSSSYKVVNPTLGTSPPWPHLILITSLTPNLQIPWAQDFGDYVSNTWTTAAFKLVDSKWRSWRLQCGWTSFGQLEAPTKGKPDPPIARRNSASGKPSDLNFNTGSSLIPRQAHPAE